MKAAANSIKSRGLRACLWIDMAAWLCIVSSNGWALNTLFLGSGGAGAEGLCIGNLRGDGRTRIGVVDAWNNGSSGFEWTFDGQWQSHAIYTRGDKAYSPLPAVSFHGMHGLLYGTYDENKIMRVGYSSGWRAPTAVFSAGGRVLCLEAAQGRNDGITRLYAATGDGAGALWELTPSANTWSSTAILTGDFGRFGVGDGRNDGVARLYAGSRSSAIGLLEITWNGTGYVADTIKRAIRVQTVYVGDGRGDGMKRIYVNEWNGRLFELTWNSGRWNDVVLAATEANRYYITSGKLRADGKKRVYVSQQGHGVVEYGWTGSGFAAVDAITSATAQVVLGDGRGDGKSRLYAAGGENSGLGAAAIEVFDNNPPEVSDVTENRLPWYVATSKAPQKTLWPGCIFQPHGRLLTPGPQHESQANACCVQVWAPAWYGHGRSP